MNHIRKFIVYLTLLVLTISGSVLLFWTFEPNEVATVTNSPVPVRPKEINPEATIIVSPIICKKIEARAHIQRTLISKAAKIPLPDYENYLPKADCKQTDLAVIIPGNTPDGVYHINYDVTYYINPITTVVIHWYTQEFSVIHIPPQKDASGVTPDFTPGSSYPTLVSPPQSSGSMQVTPIPPVSQPTTQPDNSGIITPKILFVPSIHIPSPF